MDETLFNYNIKLPFDVVGTDLASGQRGVEIFKKFKKNKNKPTKLQEAKDFYGENLPSFLQSAKAVVPEGKEKVRMYGREVVVDKDRPKGAKRIKAGLEDFINLQNYYMGLGPQTDLDKRGGFATDAGYDPTKGLDDVEYELSPLQELQLQRDIESKISEPKTALENTEEYLNSLKKAQEELLPVQRRAARAGAIDQFANYALTEPIRQMFLNRAANQAEQRYLNTRAIVEGMPSNVQKIMKSKQEQQALASAAFATEAQAIANQTDAATRMGGLGMQRRFG